MSHTWNRETALLKRLNQLIFTGIDLVHDKVEKALLKEVEMVRNCEKKLEQFMDKCVNQVCLSII